LHVEISGSINQETGFVQDFADISKVMTPLVERLDHRHLGAWEVQGEWIPKLHGFDVEGLTEDVYPSSENLLIWIAGQIEGLDVYHLIRKDHTPEPFTPYPGQLIETDEDEDEEVTLQSYWSKLALEETCTSYAELTREEFNATRNQK